MPVARTCRALNRHLPVFAYKVSPSRASNIQRVTETIGPSKACLKTTRHRRPRRLVALNGRSTVRERQVSGTVTCRYRLCAVIQPALREWPVLGHSGHWETVVVEFQDCRFERLLSENARSHDPEPPVAAQPRATVSWARTLLQTGKTRIFLANSLELPRNGRPSQSCIATDRHRG